MNDDLRIDIDETLPLVAADPALLERAVANVVANALRYRSGQPVEVSARTVGPTRGAAGDRSRPGMPADQRDRLFEPFQRLGDTGRHRRRPRAGRRPRLRHCHGRHPHPDDTPGGGLTMCIALPAADEQGSPP